MKYVIWDYNTGKYIRCEFREESFARNAIRGFARRDVKRRKYPDLITAEESYMVEPTPGKDA